MRESGTSVPHETSDQILAELVRRTDGFQPWRRFFHASSGVLLAAVLHWRVFPDPVPAWALGGLLAVLGTLDWVRLRRPEVNALFFRSFPSLASPREARRPASSTWYLLGVLLTVLLFPSPVAVPAVLILALADPTASVVGRRFGRVPLGHGSLEGTGVFFAVAFGCTVGLVGPGPALLAAATTTFVEPLPWPLDDNMTIPVVAGAALWTLGLA